MNQKSLFQPPLPDAKTPSIKWGDLHGCAGSLAIAQAAQQNKRFNLLITPDTFSANQLEYELRFFVQDQTQLPVLRFPEWETLPYDSFSPHQDIISERLAILNQLQRAKSGILIAPVQSLMNRIAPPGYLASNSFLLKSGEQLNPETLRNNLQQHAYQHVKQVTEHGEFTLRGSIIDIYPMGSDAPYRIELFDNEVETIRSFDPETQRSIEKLESINLLPANEFPLTQESLTRFRSQWRSQFHGNPTNCPVYQEISQGIPSPGVEYFIPFFFEKTATLLDYLPEDSILFQFNKIHQQAEHQWQEITKRYDQLAHDITRPILEPTQVFIPVADLFAQLKQFQQIELQTEKLVDKPTYYNFASDNPPNLSVNHKLKNPLAELKTYLEHNENRIVFCAETTGRREALLTLFKQHLNFAPEPTGSWHGFLKSNEPYCITTYPLDQGLVSKAEQLTIIAESQLFGERILQRRRRKQEQSNSDTLIKNLAELRIGDPVVHIDHGVGRYEGLQTLELNNQQDEFLTLEYGDGAKLYVPVASLHLISRYTGTDTEHAPLHKLGSEQWEKAKKKAAAKVHDVAAELLDIYARRAANQGFAFNLEQEYQTFSESFPFEETPDQLHAIEQVIQDMRSDKPMDRLICGDVGFGKTEVAMRAAFIAAANNKQVVVLTPTTLLTQQHYQTFKDRFSDWPVNIEVLSRFKTAKEQKESIEKLARGQIDIIIGTHRLLNKEIQYKNLGLLIIDEEHRFGVKQKEKIKSLRANVDILTLTATPIPRTLNMAFANMRDLSIIATPPNRRLAVKTFIQKRNDGIIREAITREIMRGGQVYFIHNKVETISKIATELEELIPEARVGVGHGQLRERELEQVMADFYHRRFNILVATTIIESGIDVPSANTIIIDRADHFGLAQLHQLRGRVGRSHHQAYAYLLAPDRKQMTSDAQKRLDAIAALKDLGIGFSLASQDLEIRGAGELLGEDQSGQMQEVGFNLYMDMLERAVKALQKGEKINLEQPLDHGVEVDLKISAIIPEDYLPDVNARLMLYKRIANAKNQNELDELQVEMVDRFGLLPEPTKNLFSVTHLKLKLETLGIQKLEATNTGGKIHFTDNTLVKPETIIHLIQSKPHHFQLSGSDTLRFTFIKPAENDPDKLRLTEGILQQIH